MSFNKKIEKLIFPFHLIYLLFVCIMYACEFTDYFGILSQYVRVLVLLYNAAYNFAAQNTNFVVPSIYGFVSQTLDALIVALTGNVI